MRRRDALGAAVAGLAGLPHPRPDQHYEPPAAGTAPGPRGQIVRARIVIVAGTSGGVFVYDPTAGAGNLIASMTDATSDPFGNPTRPGVTSYAKGGIPAYSQLEQGQILLGRTSDFLGALLDAFGVDGVLKITSPETTNTDGAAELDLLSGAASGLAGGVSLVRVNQSAFEVVNAQASGRLLQVINNTTAPTDAIARIDAGAAGDRTLGLRVQGDTSNRLLVTSDGAMSWGPGNAGQDVALSRLAASVLELGAGDGLAFAAGTAPAAQAAPLLYGATSDPGRIHELSPSGLDQPVSSAQGDTASITVTQAALTALTAAWPIPAADAAAAAAYRVTTSGEATWGATQQALTLAVNIGGSNVAQATIAAAAFAASTALQWEATAEVLVLTTGAGGTMRVKLRCTINPGGQHTVGQDVTFIRHVASSALNTNAATTLALTASWAATTGAPTITADGSVFERLAA